jgi:chromosome segregation ATPase
MDEALWGRLEAAVQSAERQCEGLRTRAAAAEAEIRRLQETLESIADSGTPATTRGDVDSLRAENAALRARFGEARRVLAMIRRRVEAIAAANE